MIIVTDLSRGPNRHNIWFTPNELDVFKANRTGHMRRVQLQISKRHTPSASDILGMEKFLSPQLTKEYIVRRSKHKKEVLKEVQSQRVASRIPHNDVDLLAITSGKNSKWARERARVAALLLDKDQETEQLQDLQQTETLEEVYCEFNDTPVHAQLQCSRREPLQETMQPRMVVPSSGVDLSFRNNCSHQRFTRDISPTHYC